MKRKTKAKATSRKQAANRARGRRNRQRGAELQRLTVKLANELGLEAYNRDRGGAQHEKGDVEIQGLYYGCKRKKVIPSWVMPEKEEIGVIFRADRMGPHIAVPLEIYLLLVSMIKKDINKD